MIEPSRPSDDVPVRPESVLPPAGAAGATTVRPQHLYKAAGLLFLFALLFHYLPDLVQTFLLAYAAIVLAVVLNALVRLFPLRRKWVTGLLGLAILAAIGAALWLGVPLLVRQLRDLTGRAEEFQAWLGSVEAWLRANTGMNVTLVGPEAGEALRSAFLRSGAGGAILSRAPGLLGTLFVPLLILFGALYATAKPNEQLLTPLLRVVPRDRRLAFRRILQLLGKRLLGWARGVLLGMVFVGILSFVFYHFIGVPNALLLAVIAGLTEAIPLLGPWIGGLVAVMVALLQDPKLALWTALAAVAVQQVENHLIVPWAMSREAEIHPFVTLFALVLFGALFGFLGVLLSIPLVLLIATVVEVLWVERAIDTDQDEIAPVVKE